MNRSKTCGPPSWDYVKKLEDRVKELEDVLKLHFNDHEDRCDVHYYRMDGKTECDCKKRFVDEVLNE
jgi:hypothetical protein